MVFTITGDVPAELRGTSLRAGDRIVTAVSYRYTEDKLRAVLRRHFSEVRCFFSDDGGTAVAVCRTT